MKFGNELVLLLLMLLLALVLVLVLVLMLVVLEVLLSMVLVVLEYCETSEQGARKAIKEQWGERINSNNVQIAQT